QVERDCARHQMHDIVRLAEMGAQKVWAEETTNTNYNEYNADDCCNGLGHEVSFVYLIPYIITPLNYLSGPSESRCQELLSNQPKSPESELLLPGLRIENNIE